MMKEQGAARKVALPKDINLIGLTCRKYKKYPDCMFHTLLKAANTIAPKYLYYNLYSVHPAISFGEM